MSEQSKWVSDDLNQDIIREFYSTMERAITQRYDAQRAQDVVNKIRDAQAQFESQHAHWIDDEQSKYHLQSMASLLASYRILLELMPKDECLALLTSAAFEPHRRQIQTSVRDTLDASADPFLEMVAASKQREEFFFGHTFTFERFQDDQQAYILHVRRCFYHQFALANGALDLMKVLCEADWVWADAIEPARHGFSFEMPTTLGYGADMCRFCFRRLTK